MYLLKYDVQNTEVITHFNSKYQYLNRQDVLTFAYFLSIDGKNLTRVYIIIYVLKGHQVKNESKKTHF